MAEGQTGEGKTAETQAFSNETARNPIIFPSSAPVCELGHLPPGGRYNGFAVLFHYISLLYLNGLTQLGKPSRFAAGDEDLTGYDLV